jgi:hypothetical protein
VSGPTADAQPEKYIGENISFLEVQKRKYSDQDFSAGESLVKIGG